MFVKSTIYKLVKKKDCQSHNYSTSLRSVVCMNSAGNPLLLGLCSNVPFTPYFIGKLCVSRNPSKIFRLTFDTK